MEEHPKKKIHIKTFIDTNPEEIDKAINEFRDKHETIAIVPNIAIDSTDTQYYHYVVFYKETKTK